MGEMLTYSPPEEERETKVEERLQYRDIPIPETIPEDDGAELLVIHENYEKAVAVAPTLYTDIKYFPERMDSPYITDRSKALMTMFLRESVAKQIETAQEKLHAQDETLYLSLLDTYRPLEYQASIFNQYQTGLRKDHPDWSDNQIQEETLKFVALPSADRATPPPHLTGGAVDLTIFRLPPEVAQHVKAIDVELPKLEESSPGEFWSKIIERKSLIDKNREYLDMGLSFEGNGEGAALNYYEKLETPSEADKVVLANRRLLYNTMVAAGFAPYAHEWWHWSSPKVQMGAKVAGRNEAEYGPIYLNKAQTE
jgi:zinc D-Ala-D-Ala dipeptidase